MSHDRTTSRRGSTAPASGRSPTARGRDTQLAAHAGSHGPFAAAARTFLAWPSLAIVVLVFVAYGAVGSAGTIWDDDWYVTRNPWLTDLDGLGRMWVPGNTVQYYPLVFTTFWIEHALWGLDPTGYHVVNVTLHALNACLVVVACRRLGLPGAWMVGALFALHPVHVESVAWITERKNVLSAFFYLLALLAYLRFDRDRHAQPAQREPSPWRAYAWALMAFVAALLSKTVTCSLPAVIVLIHVWRRDPLDRRRLAPLVPFFVVGLALALHTAHLERAHVGAEGIDFAFTPAQRVLIASRALLEYAGKLVWPHPLGFMYPKWSLDAGSISAWIPVVVCLVLVVGLLAWARRGVRGPAVASAYFAGTLFPALGFFNVYPMRYSYMADHFQYLASLGILVSGVALAARWIVAPGARAVVGGSVLVVLGTLTWRQAQVYADQGTLWRATLRHNPGAWIAHNNLGTLASDAGRHAEAAQHLNAALEHVDSPVAARQIRTNLAVCQAKLGRHAEALREYEALQGEGGGMEVKIAQCLERLQRDDEARAWFERALSTSTASAARVPFGVHWLRRGDARRAEEQFRAALAHDRLDLDARLHLADAEAAQGRVPAAIATLDEALTHERVRRDAGLASLIRQRRRVLDESRR